MPDYLTSWRTLTGFTVLAGPPEERHPNGRTVLRTDNVAVPDRDARQAIVKRAVACVRACEGVSDDVLTPGMVAEVTRQRDALLTVLRSLDALLDFSEPLDPGEYGIDSPSSINAAFAVAVALIREKQPTGESNP